MLAKKELFKNDSLKKSIDNNYSKVKDLNRVFEIYENKIAIPRL